jgi:hypothetical protein
VNAKKFLSALQMIVSATTKGNILGEPIPAAEPGQTTVMTAFHNQRKLKFWHQDRHNSIQTDSEIYWNEILESRVGEASENRIGKVLESRVGEVVAESGIRAFGRKANSGKGGSVRPYWDAFERESKCRGSFPSHILSRSKRFQYTFPYRRRSNYFSVLSSLAGRSTPEMTRTSTTEKSIAFNKILNEVSEETLEEAAGRILPAS